MGRSAKLHKRVKKTVYPPSTQLKPQPVQPARKRKSKAKARPSPQGTQGEHVLGGADYVTLLLGGRRKAAGEALKLPADPE